MEDLHRLLLQRVIFRKDLEPKKIIPYLREHRELHFDENDEQQIKAQPTRADQVDKMLDILPRRGPHAFRCLVEALKNVQPHLADLLLEGEEMEKKLSKERCNSAKLGDKLRDARVKLEQFELEKNKQENKRKQLEELLHQSENEKGKLISDINELNNMKERLTKDLEEEKQEKLTLQSKYSDLEEESQSKSKIIERLKLTCFQRKDTNINQLNLRKVSADESMTREKRPPLLRRRTHSAKSTSCDGMEEPTRIGDECIQHNNEIVELDNISVYLTDDLQEEVQVFEEKWIPQIDKAAMEDSEINICSKCIEYESVLTEYKELQQAKKKVECTLKEVTDAHEREKKNLESSLQSLEDQYNTAKQDFTNEMDRVRNEMTVKHDSEMKDLKDELESQAERDKLTMKRLYSDLYKERETVVLRVQDLEAELKEAQDGKNKGLEVISSLKAALNEEQDIQKELREELARWKRLPAGRVFNFKDDFDRNGIIYNLGTNFNTKPFVNPAKSDNATIKVRRSSCNQGQPSDILDLAHCKGTLSCTADIEYSWWQVDLGEKYVLYVTHYTLRHGNDKAHSILRNWNLEGSRDGKNWMILSSHDNDRGLKGTYPFYTGTWAVEGKVEAMRYFRIHQTGKNSAGRYALYLSGFEIYGVLLKL